MTEASIERNAQALIALVADDARRRIAATLDAARDEAARVRRDAHAAARAAVAAAYANERQRHAERVAAAQAALATRERLALQRRHAALVAAALEALPEALRERWRDPRSREAWVDRAFAQARAALPRSPWDIVHPATWPAAERDGLAACVARATGHAPTMAADASLDAGLALAAGGARVDARIPGLLADRRALGARLLHHAQPSPLPGASMSGPGPSQAAHRAPSGGSAAAQAASVGVVP